VQAVVLSGAQPVLPLLIEGDAQAAVCRAVMAPQFVGHRLRSRCQRTTANPWLVAGSRRAR
jgi:hypothetical protein